MKLCILYEDMTYEIVDGISPLNAGINATLNNPTREVRTVLEMNEPKISLMTDTISLSNRRK